MTIGDYIETFYDYPVFDFEPGEPVDTSKRQAYRIHCEYDSELSGVELL